MSEWALELDGLEMRYGDHVAVDGVDLTAADGEVLCVLGPSGCGKSTLLRAVAGLHRPHRGTVRLAGRDVTALRPDRRGVGLMFQDHALFPHRTVGENVTFGPRMLGLSRAEIESRVTEALELVDLPRARRRPVGELSGGEQQRVALARAIAPRPTLLMLDEPLGSLDRALRERLLEELPSLLRRLGTTVLYVTHDQDEALGIADRVAVMRDGRIEQVAPTETVWREPATEFVAGFLGLDLVLDAQVRAGRLDTPLGYLPLRGDHPDGPVRVVVHPTALRLVEDDCRFPGLLVTGQVTARRLSGGQVRVEVATDPGPSVRVTAIGDAGPTVGDRVRLALDPAGVHVLPERPRTAPNDPEPS